MFSFEIAYLLQSPARDHLHTCFWGKQELCLTCSYNTVSYLSNSGPDSSLKHAAVKHDWWGRVQWSGINIQDDCIISITIQKPVCWVWWCSYWYGEDRVIMLFAFLKHCPISVSLWNAAWETRFKLYFPHVSQINWHHIFHPSWPWLTIK